MSLLPRKLYLSLRRRLLGRGKPHSAQYWDVSYPSGRWDYLDSPAERPRFDALVTLVVRHHTPPGAILDVGCGTGTLARCLPPELRTFYVGTDLSTEALAKARACCTPDVRFIHEAADVSQPTTVGNLAPFSVVVLSEVLYYLDDPFQALRFYRAHLSPTGVVIISLWNPRRHTMLRWRLQRQLQVISKEFVQPAGKASWELLVAR